MSFFKYKDPLALYMLRNAMRQGKLHEVERLLHHNNFDSSDFSYRDETPLYLACASGNKQLVDIVVAQKGYLPDSHSLFDETCLHVAAELGFEHIVETLLKWGADLSSRTKGGITPLHLAALGGHEGVIRLLLENGANVKDKEDHGFTALHMTCIDGHCELVRVLIEAGANVNEPSEAGIAPLHIAAAKGHTWMVRELTESGAEVDLLTRCHCTSLDCAIRSGQIEVAKVLIESGASLDGNQGGSGTPLRNAAFMQDCAMVELLLEHGAEVDPRALVIACDSLNNNPDDRIVQILLAYGVDVNFVGRGGLTALHYAIFHSRKAVVELLLEHGANVNRPTRSGQTPLQFACNRKVYSPLTAMSLLEYGADFTSEDEILRCSNAYFKNNTAFEQWNFRPLDLFDFFFTKLQTAGLCSPDEIMIYPPDLSQPLNRRNKEEYRRVCAMEVSFMKEKTIGSSGVSYYDLLRRTVAICRNDEVTGALPKDFRADFPHYGQILNIRVRKGLRRWKLINRSYSFFPRLMKFDFPAIVTDHVFSYLSNQDLENIIEVGMTLRKPTSDKVIDDLPAVDPVLTTKFTALENNSQKRQTGTLEREEAGDDETIKKIRL